MQSGLSAGGRKGAHGPFRVILIFSLLVLAIATASRIGLGLWQGERVAAVDGWSHLLLQGIRVDIATLCWLWGVAALGTAIFSGDHLIPRSVDARLY